MTIIVKKFFDYPLQLLTQAVLNDILVSIGRTNLTLRQTGLLLIWAATKFAIGFLCSVDSVTSVLSPSIATRVHILLFIPSQLLACLSLWFCFFYRTEFRPTTCFDQPITFERPYHSGTKWSRLVSDHNLNSIHSLGNTLYIYRDTNSQ